MLFLLIVSQAVMEVQKQEQLDAEDEHWRVLSETMTSLVDAVSQQDVFTRVLLEIARHTPFTSQSTKSRVGGIGSGSYAAACPDSSSSPFLHSIYYTPYPPMPGPYPVYYR